MAWVCGLGISQGEWLKRSRNTTNAVSMYTRYSGLSKEQTLSHQLLSYSTSFRNFVVILSVLAVVAGIILIWFHEGTAPVVTLVHLV